MHEYILKWKIAMLSAGYRLSCVFGLRRQSLSTGGMLIILISMTQSCQSKEHNNNGLSDTISTQDYETCYRTLVLGDTLFEPDTNKAAIYRSKANNNGSLKDL